MGAAHGGGEAPRTGGPSQGGRAAQGGEVGHFGRLEFSWERTDKVAVLKAAAK